MSICNEESIVDNIIDYYKLHRGHIIDKNVVKKIKLREYTISEPHFDNCTIEGCFDVYNDEGEVINTSYEIFLIPADMIDAHNENLTELVYQLTEVALMAEFTPKGTIDKIFKGGERFKNYLKAQTENYEELLLLQLEEELENEAGERI